MSGGLRGHHDELNREYLCLDSALGRLSHCPQIPRVMIIGEREKEKIEEKSRKAEDGSK
jgi:hypothetical protein